MSSAQTSTATPTFECTKADPAIPVQHPEQGSESTTESVRERGGGFGIPTEILQSCACLLWAMIIVNVILINSSIGFIEESEGPIGVLRFLFFLISASCTFIWANSDLQVDHSGPSVITERNMTLSLLQAGLVGCAYSSFFLFARTGYWYTSLEVKLV